MKTTIVMGLLVGALMLAAAPARAASSDASLEQLVIEMAESPAQHAALARHYRAEAAEARAEQTRHEQMAKTYGGQKQAQRMHMKEHCDEIAKQYGELASQYDAMAELQESQAK